MEQTRITDYFDHFALIAKYEPELFQETYPSS